MKRGNDKTPRRRKVESEKNKTDKKLAKETEQLKRIKAQKIAKRVATENFI